MRKCGATTLRAGLASLDPVFDASVRPPYSPDEADRWRSTASRRKLLRSRLHEEIREMRP
jgi:hypothetical protein